jgi:hypothetical protein
MGRVDWNADTPQIATKMLKSFMVVCVFVVTPAPLPTCRLVWGLRHA